MNILKNNAIIEKIINILLNILIGIFGMVLLISIYTGVQTKMLRHSYSDFFGYSLFEVQTGSMEPEISVGDWIIVKLTQNVGISDIITYRLGSEFVTHRVIEAYRGTYITMGDANNSKDKPVDQNQIVGKVVNILPGFGILRKTLFNPVVLITLMVTLFLFNYAFTKNKKIVEVDKGMIFDALIRKLTQLFGKLLSIIVKYYEKNKDKFEKLSNEDKTVKLALEEKVIEEKNVNDDKTEKIADEDLEKTSLFRMVSTEEVSENYEEIKEEIQNQTQPEDLEKTSLFRIISVDTDNVDKTLLEIAENELKEKNRLEKLKEQSLKKELDTPGEDEKESLTNIDLELLKSKTGVRKGKTIIDSALNIKRKEIIEIISGLIVNNRINTYKSVKDPFIESYLNIKYFNHSLSKELEERGLSLLKIKKVINDTAVALVKTYKGKDPKFNEVVGIYTNLMLLISVLDQAKLTISEIKIKRELYKKELLKLDKTLTTKKLEEKVKEILEIQKKYNALISEMLKKLETNTFELNENQIRKNVFAITLKHNITFSKVYSNYIVDKTYKEGIIAEDKVSVLLNLLSVKLTKDMLISDFGKKYIIYLPSSLYEKEKKYEKLLRIIEDEFAKENVYILIKYDDLVNNKLLVKRIKKNGYRFALIIEKNTLIKEKDKNSMVISDFIFIGRKDPNLTKIPEELRSSIIYEDILEKMEGSKGE